MFEQRDQRPRPATRAKYGKWTSADMEKALASLRQNEMGLNEAARAYAIPKATLSRHLKEQNKAVTGSIKHLGRFTYLTAGIEQELVEHCLQLEKMFFGLSVDDLRRLAFDVAERNGYAHVVNREKRMAGKKWYYFFMRRHRSYHYERRNPRQ